MTSDEQLLVDISISNSNGSDKLEVSKRRVPRRVLRYSVSIAWHSIAYRMRSKRIVEYSSVVWFSIV